MALGGSELIRRCKFYEYSRELKSHDPEDSRGRFQFTSDIQRRLLSGSIGLIRVESSTCHPIVARNLVR